MHATWHNFLHHHGAHFTGDSVAHFGDPAAELQAAEHGTVLADLSQEGLIRIEGPDAHTFLQGQLSTDALALSPATSQLSSWNNARGRVVTLLRLFEHDAAIYMTLPQALTAPVLKRLGMYVLRSKVKLTDTSDTFAHFGIAGSSALDLLTSCGLPVPAQVNAVALKDGIHLTRLHGDTPRFLLHGGPEKLMQVWETLVGKGASPVGSAPWSLLRILAREPVVYPETSEHFVAQMLGLEELGAINFKKGCYLGQEVIARAHYRGAVKRHLRRAVCETSIPPKPGMLIHARESDQGVAEIIDAARDAAGRWQMLVVLQDEFANALLHINHTTVSLFP